jgi:hypothetical protein
MISSKDFYNFLMKQAEPEPQLPPVPPLPAVPDPMQGMMPPSGNMPSDDERVETLRLKLQALVGNVIKRSEVEVDTDVSRVFGDQPGEIDPETTPLDPEWESILQLLLSEEKEPSASQSQQTQSLRRPKPT